MCPCCIGPYCSPDRKAVYLKVVKTASFVLSVLQLLLVIGSLAFGGGMAPPSVRSWALRGRFRDGLKSLPGGAVEARCRPRGVVVWLPLPGRKTPLCNACAARSPAQVNPMLGPSAQTLDNMGAKNTYRIVFQYQVRPVDRPGSCPAVDRSLPRLHAACCRVAALSANA
jgi:hypothetical protein